MRGCFYLRTLLEEVWILVPGAGVTPPGGALLVPRAEAAFAVRSWLGRGLSGRADRVAIVEALSGATAARSADDRALESRIAAALADGRLRAFRRQEPLDAPTAAEGEAPSERRPSAGPAEEKTWIGIELVEEDPPHRPIPYARYRIELPDQSVREGILDERGRAEIRGIDPGVCKISFPDRHRADWRAA
jgi:hypothetical protein